MLKQYNSIQALLEASIAYSVEDPEVRVIILRNLKDLQFSELSRTQITKLLSKAKHYFSSS